uniref:LEM domain-containing protein n=1 Tax=Anopheles christyi TaxID=43041 RepID=A0A182JPB1_9DIPT
MGDNFDEMSNDQLRLKLLEFGLSNMPVTSTTRKVLIKKLRNHISSNGAAGKARRETIHLTKYSSDEDSEPVSSQNTGTKKTTGLTKKEVTNRRATIASGGGAAASTKLPKFISSSQPTPKVTETLPPEPGLASKRRSGRVTPVKDKDAAMSGSSTKGVPKVPAILEDSDDDMVPLTQLTQRDRKSKSPSLSRAEMLTTSYIHQIEVSAPKAPTPIVEEMEIDLPELGKNIDEMEVIVLDDDNDSDIASVSMPPPQQLPKPPAVKESFSQTTSQTTSETRRTLTTANTAMTDNRKGKAERIFAEPTTVNYGTTERTLPKPTFASPSIRNSMSSTVRAETGPKYDPTDSPYLSEFTKRLSRLRAEATQQPGAGARDSPSRRTMFEGSTSSMRSTYVSGDAYEESSSSRYRAGRQTIAPVSTAGRRTATETNDVRSSVRQKLLALDRKYSFRKVFYSIIIVLVVIFLFVFFFL